MSLSIIDPVTVQNVTYNIRDSSTVVAGHHPVAFGAEMSVRMSTHNRSLDAYDSNVESPDSNSHFVESFGQLGQNPVASSPADRATIRTNVIETSVDPISVEANSTQQPFQNGSVSAVELSQGHMQSSHVGNLQSTFEVNILKTVTVTDSMLQGSEQAAESEAHIPSMSMISTVSMSGDNINLENPNQRAQEPQANGFVFAGTGRSGNDITSLDFTDIISKATLHKLAKEIAGWWKEFAMALDPARFSMNGKIAVIDTNVNYSTPTLKAQAMLEIWRDDQGRKATAAALIRTLCRMGKSLVADNVFGQSLVN